MFVNNLTKSYMQREDEGFSDNGWYYMKKMANSLVVLDSLDKVMAGDVILGRRAESRSPYMEIANKFYPNWRKKIW